MNKEDLNGALHLTIHQKADQFSNEPQYLGMSSYQSIHQIARTFCSLDNQSVPWHFSRKHVQAIHTPLLTVKLTKYALLHLMFSWIYTYTKSSRQSRDCGLCLQGNNKWITNGWFRTMDTQPKVGQNWPPVLLHSGTPSTFKSNKICPWISLSYRCSKSSPFSFIPKKWLLVWPTRNLLNRTQSILWRSQQRAWVFE